MNVNEINVRTARVVDAAMKVHSTLGPGLLERAYEACLAYELRKRGLHVVTQPILPVIYDDIEIELAYRLDLLVDNAVIVELKTVSKLLAIHKAQLLSYLKLSQHRVGLLINFREVHLKNGIKRLVNRL
ncbi:MAG: GxxExxY protein [Gemmatimonadaceae bacterium]